MTAMGVFLFRLLALATVAALCATGASAKNVKRCGWYANPTPGNHWLTDADSTWVLSTQGGPEVPGWMDLPAESFDFDPARNWVEVNGSYGYGCACITGQFGAVDEGEVRRVASMTALPLARCTADPKLPLAEG